MLAVIEIAGSTDGTDGFPVSIAWGIVGGNPDPALFGHMLIRPAPHWHVWDRMAERTHQISRTLLDQQGLPPDEAVLRLRREMAGASLFSDAINLHQAWLDRLTAAVPGAAGFSLRRYRELFPGARPADIETALQAAPTPNAPFVTLAALKTKLAVADQFLSGVSRAARSQIPG